MGLGMELDKAKMIETIGTKDSRLLRLQILKIGKVFAGINKVEKISNPFFYHTDAPTHGLKSQTFFVAKKKQILYLESKRMDTMWS
tara:strand:- start:1790 stop:2047 length:258 start_codon:yes stop_codon:yes gene_type:complete